MTKQYVPMRVATCRELQVASNRAITYGRVADALHLGVIEGIQKARDRGRLMAEVTSLEAYIRANVAGGRVDRTLDTLREKLERSGGPRTLEGPGRADWGTAEWDGHRAAFAHALPGPTAAVPPADDAAEPGPAPQQEVLFRDPDEVIGEALTAAGDEAGPAPEPAPAANPAPAPDEPALLLGAAEFITILRMINWRRDADEADLQKLEDDVRNPAIPDVLKPRADRIDDLSARLAFQERLRSKLIVFADARGFLIHIR